MTTRTTVTTRRVLRCATLMLACGALTGCAPKMTMDDLKESMPQRPAELDLLNAFVGNWETEGEVRMAGLDEVLTSRGTSDMQWHGDKWFLVGNWIFTMGELGETTGLETWTYDIKAKKFRSTWTDSMGAIGMGTARYDEKNNTWHMRAKSYGPWGESTGKGSVKMLDDDTMEFNWAEYAMGGLMKTMEMTGTSRRK